MILKAFIRDLDELSNSTRNIKADRKRIRLSNGVIKQGSAIKEITKMANEVNNELKKVFSSLSKVKDGVNDKFNNDLYDPKDALSDYKEAYEDLLEARNLLTRAALGI